MSNLSQVAGIYFLLQAGGVVGWWALLWLHPEYRIPFQLDVRSETALLAFWLPDLVLLAGGSLAASVWSFRRSALLPYALWFVTGSVSYATLYCLAGALITNGGWLSVVLMAPAMLLSLVLTLALIPQSRRLLRQARPGSVGRNLTKTVVQIVIFWGVLLFVVPAVLVELQERVGIPLVAFPFQKATAAALFLAFSAVGLWSGYTMSRFGQGTPLPLDSPRALVVRGPYAFVRNPMAIAGLGQGVSVSLYTGSALVLGYVLLGTFIWQYVARPVEEEDLSTHFGAEYERYRQQVRCWCPSRTPFQSDPPAA
ncbi:MAG TPA: isoprenylcysteine carboxylmethyltransferase family protein [Longimicrobiaceae bacterium]|nr:isoprenylcysteine carboxylmethyltransferase family protein [Longimicrobiaceae bacterium]